MEHAGTAIAVERLQDDITKLAAELQNLLRILGDQRFGHQVGEFGDEDLFRAVADPCRIVHHQRLWMNTLQKMRCGDVVHVERRVLTQQNHIHFRHVATHRLTQRVVITLDVADFHFFNASRNNAIAHGKAVRRVMIQLMAALLSFKRQSKSGVTRNIDRADMVHLDRNF
ncbi:hypothetical protein FQZ97_924360 [compost metagenome]